MTDASVTPNPPPPYSAGISAASHPAAVSARTNSSGYPAASSIFCQYWLLNRPHNSRTAERYSWKKAERGLMSFMQIPERKRHIVEGLYRLYGGERPPGRLLPVSRNDQPEKLLFEFGRGNRVFGISPRIVLGVFHGGSIGEGNGERRRPGGGIFGRQVRGHG